MGRKKQKNSRVLTIVIILFILLIVDLILLNTYAIYVTGKEKDKKASYNATITVCDEKLNEANNNKNELNNKIIELNNIEENFTKLKSEYFGNIKKLEDKILAGKSKKKIAYITFDDGPYYLTYKYLKVLKKYNINATFFNIGLNKESCYDNPGYNCYKLYKEIANDDHTIANHTYSHLIFNGLYSSTSSFMTQVTKMENLIKKQTGLTTNIVRFPGGSATAGGLKNSIIKELRKKKYGWVDWTAQDGDGGNLSSASEAMANIKSTVKDDIEVILLHDYNHITYSVLPDIIEYLQKKGYIILPLFYESNMINK